MNEKNTLTVTERLSDTVAKAEAKIAVKTVNVLGKLMTNKVGKTLVTLPLALALCTVTVAAAAEGDADSTIQSIIDLLRTWIPRLGGLLVVVGGIQLGIGFKDDDATGKTRGMQCMIGGAIVAAIGTAVNF